MPRKHRHLVHWTSLTVIAAVIAACAGTTSIQTSHPLLATDATSEKSMVYFIRPDPGFRGVMDRPLTINLGGKELLSLSKGQYTLLPLTPGNADLKVHSHTVVGTSNTMTPVSTTTQLTFPARETIYLVFEIIPQGGLSGSVFVPRRVSRERALEATHGLVPIGMAIKEPLS